MGSLQNAATLEVRLQELQTRASECEEEARRALAFAKECGLEKESRVGQLQEERAAMLLYLAKTYGNDAVAQLEAAIAGVRGATRKQAREANFAQVEVNSPVGI